MIKKHCRYLALASAMTASLICGADSYPKYYWSVHQYSVYNDAYPGILLSWQIEEHKIRSAGSSVSYPYPYSCISTVYRDGVAIANVTSKGTETRITYRDYAVRANTTHKYYIVAMGETSNIRTSTCPWSYWADLSTESITLEAEGGIGVVTVSSIKETRELSSGSYIVTTSTVDWSAVTGDSWITVAKSGNALTISADANNTGATRQGVVKVRIQGYDIRKITVSQDSTNIVSVETGGGNDVPIPKSWFDENCPDIVDENYRDYGAVAKSTAANGRTVWECFLAGLDPMDESSRFEAKISMRDGVPEISWEPNLNTNEHIRTYTIFGMTNLTDSAWHSPTNESSRFFKIGVGLP